MLDGLVWFHGAKFLEGHIALMLDGSKYSQQQGGAVNLSKLIILDALGHQR